MQFHKPKEFAISISLEASGSFETLQLKSSKEETNENLEYIKEEIAVLIFMQFYCHSG